MENKIKYLKLKSWNDENTSPNKFSDILKENFTLIEDFMNNNLRYKSEIRHIVNDENVVVYDTPSKFTAGMNEFDVYLNRVIQIKGIDYDEYIDDGIILKEPPVKGDEILIVQRVFANRGL